METRFAPGTKVHCTVVVLPHELLIDLLHTKKGSLIFNKISSDAESFWLDTDMTPDIQNVLKQIDHSYADGFLDEPFYQLKAQELTYRLFTELLKEERGQPKKLKKIGSQATE